MALEKQRQDDLEWERIRFPADDGVPMEDERHVLNMVKLIVTLDDYLKEVGRPAEVCGNNFIYYDRTDPRKNVGPDFYVVFGARPDPDRDAWRLWREEGAQFRVVVEFLSKSTRKKDLVTNFAIYRDILRIQNYFVCDNRKYHLQGWRLSDAEYVPIEPNQRGWLYSDQLDLYLGFHERFVRFFTTAGRLIETNPEQAVAAREQAKAAKAQAKAAREQAKGADHKRRAAEVRVAQLEEEVRRMKGSQG